MAILYHCVAVTDNPTSASMKMFNCQNLRLTQDLLHDKDPELAEQLVFLLHKYCSNTPGDKPRQIDFLLLIEELGAPSITRIIADLTVLGTQRVEQPTAQIATKPDSTKLFKQLLDDWITLGDWLIHTAIVDGLPNH